MYTNLIVENGNLEFLSQASIIKEYPHKITAILIYSFFVAVLCAMYTSTVEKDSNAWKLMPGIEMIAVLCSVSETNISLYIQKLVRGCFCH